MTKFISFDEIYFSEREFLVFPYCVFHTVTVALLGLSPKTRQIVIMSIYYLDFCVCNIGSYLLFWQLLLKFCFIALLYPCVKGYLSFFFSSQNFSFTYSKQPSSLPIADPRIAKWNLETHFTSFRFFSSKVNLFLFLFDGISLLSDMKMKVTKVSRKMPKCFLQFNLSQRLGFSGSGEIVHLTNFIWRQKLYRSGRWLQKSCDSKNFGAI